MHFILQHLLPMFVVLMWNGCIIFFVWIAADYYRRYKLRHQYLPQPVKLNRTPSRL
nr:hypothetical protein [Mucilaginibacter sp. L294]